MYLYIDTTQYVCLGLLNEDFQWVDYCYIETKKSSQIIHKLIFELLEKAGTKLACISGLFYAAGPGSYTGMRVSEGIKDVLSWQNCPVYSFYHFNVPQLYNHDKGFWISKAFKGEFFVYEWTKSSSAKTLVLEKDLKEKLSNSKLFSGCEKFGPMDVALTKDLIYEKPEVLFRVLKEKKITRELYYYRPLEEEFKRSNG